MTDNARILLIDDNPEFVEANQMMLEAFGYDVSTSHNGSDGFAKAMAERPDLIVLDVMMDYDTEGLDTARKINSAPELANTKVLLVSGVAAELELKRTLSPDENWLPVDCVLEKPIDPRKLLKVIEKKLSSKKNK